MGTREPLGTVSGTRIKADTVLVKLLWTTASSALGAAATPLYWVPVTHWDSPAQAPRAGKVRGRAGAGLSAARGRPVGSPPPSTTSRYAITTRATGPRCRARARCAAASSRRCTSLPRWPRRRQRSTARPVVKLYHGPARSRRTSRRAARRRCASQPARSGSPTVVRSAVLLLQY